MASFALGADAPAGHEEPTRGTPVGKPGSRAGAVHPETFYAPTADGWKIAVHHWSGRGSARRHPVMMVHGLGANRLNFHPSEDYSVALAMANRGFDVFVVELRGAGLSRGPGARSASGYEWGFSEYADLDLPAAIDLICQRTDADEIHGLGHSMGGMLLYRLAANRVSSLRSVIAVGSPLVNGIELGSREAHLLRAANRIVPNNAINRVPLRRLLGAAGHLGTIGTWLADGMLVNGDNVDPTVIMYMAQAAINDVPVRLVRELAERIESGPSDSGPYAYEDHLDQIEVPMLVVSGEADRIAPATAVRRAFTHMGSPNIRYREMGRSHGDSVDYGHVDLIVGLNAPQEVFPILFDFLEEVD